MIKTQIELCYDSGWFKDTMMVMYLDEIEPTVPIRRMAICQCITAILDAYFFDDKERKNFIELKSTDEEKCKVAIAMIFYYATAWAFGGIVNEDAHLKFFDQQVRQKCEGMPKDKPLLD